MKRLDVVGEEPTELDAVLLEAADAMGRLTGWPIRVHSHQFLRLCDVGLLRLVGDEYNVGQIGLPLHTYTLDRL